MQFEQQHRKKARIELDQTQVNLCRMDVVYSYFFYFPLQNYKITLQNIYLHDLTQWFFYQKVTLLHLYI